jgi:hypothetical protein
LLTDPDSEANARQANEQSLPEEGMTVPRWPIVLIEHPAR